MAGISYDDLIKQGATPMDSNQQNMPQQGGGMSYSQLRQQGATSEEPKKQGLLGRIKENFTSRFAEQQDNLARTKAGGQTKGEYVLQGIGHGAGAVAESAFDVGLSSAKGIYKAVTPDKVEEQNAKIASATGLAILKTPLGQAGLSALEGGMDMYDSWKEGNPRAAADLEAVIDIASIIPTTKATQLVGKGVVKVGEEAIDLASDAATTTRMLRGTGKMESKLDASIDAGIDKGIKPSIKQTPQKLEQYKENARNAVKTIVKYKDKLGLTDDFGEATGKLPQNLNQFTQAVDKTKTAIYNQYNKLAKQAGASGANVPLTSIAKELIGVTNNKVMQDIAPEVVNYAKKRAASLQKRGQYTAEQAQEAIQQLNSSLESFYKNPNYSDFSKLQIDALIVNNMRRSLDDVIQSATGKEYQKLKKLYGSLKAIEKDVTRRAVVDARKNAKGLVDFTDIFSAGDIVAGAMSLNPAQVGKGVIQKTIAEMVKMKNDPNRTIKKMFEGAEKTLQKIDETKKPFQPKSNTLQYLGGKGGMNIKDVSGDPRIAELNRTYKQMEKRWQNASGTTKKQLDKAMANIVKEINRISR